MVLQFSTTKMLSATSYRTQIQYKMIELQLHYYDLIISINVIIII